MSIDEAIERENKIAEENQKIVDTQIVFDDVSLSQLYCDDTEVIEEHLSNYRKCSEYHKKIAEWLEDYKRIKMFIPLEQALKAEYNKAIDDFVKAIVDRGLSSNDDKYCITRYDNYLKVIKEIAEQLKAGGNIELSEYSKSKGNRTGKQKAT